MSEKEFLQLKVNTVVSLKRETPQTYYVIFDDDIMGSSHKGNAFKVFGAKELDGINYIRISSSNYQFYNIEGYIRDGK